MLKVKERIPTGDQVIDLKTSSSCPHYLILIASVASFAHPATLAHAAPSFPHSQFLSRAPFVVRPHKTNRFGFHNFLEESDKSVVSKLALISCFFAVLTQVLRENTNAQISSSLCHIQLWSFGCTGPEINVCRTL